MTFPLRKEKRNKIQTLHIGFLSSDYNSKKKMKVESESFVFTPQQSFTKMISEMNKEYIN